MQEPFNVCRMLKNKITDRVYLLNKNISVTSCAVCVKMMF
mgnify:FL=1